MTLFKTVGPMLAALALGLSAAQAQPVELTFANALSLPQVEPYQKAVDEFSGQSRHQGDDDQRAVVGILAAATG